MKDRDSYRVVERHLGELGAFGRYKADVRLI